MPPKKTYLQFKIGKMRMADRIYNYCKFQSSKQPPTESLASCLDPFKPINR